MPPFPRTSFIGGLACLCMTAGCMSIPVSPYLDAELAAFPTERLARYYISLDASHGEEIARILGLLKTRDLDDAFRVIVDASDAYDPATRASERYRAAYWSLDLLTVIDHNIVRVRALSSGQAAIAACGRRLDRQARAGWSREPDSTDEAAVARIRGYRIERQDYEGLLGPNGKDYWIVFQLERDFGAKLSDGDRRRFSDFLTAKDPRYVAWSPWEMVNRKATFRDFKPYYEAYLEFRKGEPIKR